MGIRTTILLTPTTKPRTTPGCSARKSHAATHFCPNKHRFAPRAFQIQHALNVPACRINFVLLLGHRGDLCHLGFKTFLHFLLHFRSYPMLQQFLLAVGIRSECSFRHVLSNIRISEWKVRVILRAYRTEHTAASLGKQVKCIGFGLALHPSAEAVLAKEVLFGCVTLDAISELEVVKADLTLVRATKCDHRQWYTHARHPVNAIIRILRPTWSHTIESGLPLLHYLLVGLLVA